MNKIVKKILLVSSSFEESSLITAGNDPKLEIKLTDESHYPLGMAYLHSYLESIGHDVQTLFLNNRTYEGCFQEIIRVVDEFCPDIVGFQILTPNRISSYRLIRHLNDKYPDIRLIAGGVHTTIMYKQLLDQFPYLITVIGEGEITLSELIEELFSDDPDLGRVDGIAFTENNTMRTTKPRELIPDLDLLPFPKHDIFFGTDRTCGSIITTRGCPSGCSFCCLKAISRRRVRYRSVTNIVDEIEWMAGRYPQMTKIWFHDDTFFVNNTRAIEVCNEIIKRKINLEFICSGRIKPISKELIKKLEEANFKLVLLGIESGDNNILKRCHKGITQEDILRTFRLFAKSKLKVHAFLIVGLPGENLNTILNTAKLIKEIQRIKYLYYKNCAVLTVYPGTEVYEIAKKGGMINDEFWMLDGTTPLFTLENSQETLFYFKDILLSHISFDRAFVSFTNFKNQIMLMPQIVKYCLENKISTYLLSLVLPCWMYNSLRGMYRAGKSFSTAIIK